MHQTAEAILTTKTNSNETGDNAVVVGQFKST